MADGLTHVFVAYAAFTAASWYVEWLDSEWVAVGAVGALLPDLNRLELLVEGDAVSSVLGLPFAWGGLHTLGGVLLLSGIGGLLFERRRDRLRGFALLLAGSVSHIVVDVPQRYADGKTLTNYYLFPFSSVRESTPGWYVSADRWVVASAFVVALAVFLVDRFARE